MTKNLSIFQKILSLSWSMIGLITAVACIGFVVLYSAAEGSLEPWADKQIIRFFLFIPIMIIIAIIDIKFWFKLSYIFYFIVLMALVLTEFAGYTSMGATRWLRLGPLSIQPSESMKVALIFALAHYFHTIGSVNIGRMTYLIPPIIMVLLPVGLVLKQPDLGTALIILAVGGLVFFAAGVRIWKFALVIAIVLAAMPVLWNQLHDYQKQRVFTFLDPESDPKGSGYHVLQSKIAIGSGGVSGKGFLKGTQSQLSFLPEKQTDFIFTMFTEEFGFIGGVTVISLYAILITYGMFIASTSRNRFGRLMAIGCTSLVFFHVFINMAMVMGLIPVVGVPLPLLSYGGTIMITILVAFGLVLNVGLYSEDNFDKETWFG